MTEVIINDHIILIKSMKFQEIEAAVIAEMRSWNNFNPIEPLKIEVSKIDDPDALGAIASEDINTADLFGRV